MHECPECGQTCDCDGEDIWRDWPFNLDCTHECEKDDDDLYLDDTSWSEEEMNPLSDTPWHVDPPIERFELSPELREFLGQRVRIAWVAYCKETGDTKLSHIAPWEELSEWDKEADRRIAEAIVKWLDPHTDTVGRFELRQDEDTGRLYWWGAEGGWKDPTEIGENGVLTLDAGAFVVGTVLTFTEPIDQE